MKGKLLILTKYFPPFPTGASFVMGNLVKAITKIKNYTPFIVTSYDIKYSKKILLDNYKIFYISPNLRRISTKIDDFIHHLLRNASIKMINKLVEKHKIDKLLVVFPDLHFLSIGYDIAYKKGISLKVYLHDTLVESLSDNLKKSFANNLQHKIFSYTDDIFVINEGLKKFYLKKYNKITNVLPHLIDPNEYTYPTYIKYFNRIVFSGGVYNINDVSLIRFSTVLSELFPSYTFITTGAYKYKKYKFKNIYIKNRELLPFLASSKAVLLALNWPFDTNMSYDELSTIFPTKTLLYLISRRPIIIYCPRDYYLSEFFHRFNYPYIINEKDLASLKTVINDINLHFYIDNNNEFYKKFIINILEYFTFKCNMNKIMELLK